MEILDFLQSNNIEYKLHIPLKTFTGMNLEGDLSVVAYPDTPIKLVVLYRFLLTSSFTYEIVGGMTNTYFCSNIKRDLIVKTTKLTFCEKSGNLVKVGSGYNLSKLAKEMVKMGVVGFEGLVGIPGTIGAAAINNSGAFGYDMSQVVKEVEIITPVGMLTYDSQQMRFSSRDSILKGKAFGVVTAVTFDLSRRDRPDNLQRKVAQYETIRKKYIDGKRKSLGSTISAVSLSTLWRHHRFAFYFKKILYLPFKYTKWNKRAKCWLDFMVLGIPHLAKHCDSIGRFCWSKDTTEVTFFEYLEAMKRVSENNVIFEIEIKK